MDIGAGALGCEYSKIICLMGACNEGIFTIADADTIALSNLNR